MDFTFDIALKTRILFYKTLENLTLDQLNTKPKGFNNTIFWNIKHVVITQQLLIYRLSELPVLVTETEIGTYKKGTKSESKATIEDIELLKYQLFSTLEKTKEDYQKGLFKKYTAYTVSTKSILTSIDEALAFNNSHEGIHFGYILAMKKIL
ncbi:MAG: DinB family protein [Flavobacteriaceae bacterium]|nr:DinB family protein [Flavobacteriaceae bacterium]|tara:strand:- start:70357 stop:70812 length:456 start_codon:yes stop_codon:yes gene_type:complete